MSFLAIIPKASWACPLRRSPRKIGCTAARSSSEGCTLQPYGKAPGSSTAASDFSTVEDSRELPYVPLRKAPERGGPSVFVHRTPGSCAAPLGVPPNRALSPHLRGDSGNYALPTGAYLLHAKRGFAISPLNPHIHRGVLYPRVPHPYVLVVLLRSVPGIGGAGEVKYVRRGLFRHHLGRMGWALPATWQNIDLVHSRMLSLQRRQQQQQKQQKSSEPLSTHEGLRQGPGGERLDILSAAAAAADIRGVDLPVDDEGPVLAWVRKLRLLFAVETEPSDSTQLAEPLTPQQLLQRLSEEEGLDLLPGQLRLLRRRITPSPLQQQQPKECHATEEILQGRPLAAITRVGEYDLLAILPTKARPLARPFSIEVLSKENLRR
ncbi:uncharacterized protein LOC34622047 [Cyclospora cayetanensis]|nr:uncharacterized protein LOC34622047 [Cyclospora cayetanensis]